MPVEQERIRKLNSIPERADAQYVLYWTGANRRVDANHALLYAAEIANRLALPLLYYEGLSCTYPGANDRLHTFLLENVADTARRLRKHGIGYRCNVRTHAEDPLRAVMDLARDAAAMVVDDYPVFFPRMLNERLAHAAKVACYAVDASCVVPMSMHTARQHAAYTIRPRIHRVLERFLKPPDGLRVHRRFNQIDVPEETPAALVARCSIDHSVQPIAGVTGGREAAEKHLKRFVKENLLRYERDKNEPSLHATSGLSPYLHFGHLGALEVALAVTEYAREHKLFADAFLEELIVRRELAFNYCRFTDHPASFENLPGWAIENMKKHARDKRDPVYTAAQLASSATYDELWNATQKEMLVRGRIHGYYRMYWGKKIIEWSPTYEAARDFMIETHTRYALDGRDPNTYANVLWCFGLHDRPFPERPIFGTMRPMSLAGMQRKTDVKAYLSEIAAL